MQLICSSFSATPLSCGSTRLDIVDPQPDEPVLRKADAASYLGISLRTLEYWLRPDSGKRLPFRRVGARPVFSKAGLDRWLAAQQTPVPI